MTYAKKGKKLADLTPFLQHVVRLKHVKRAGWILTANVNNPESVADHSYSACAISMVLSDIFGLDTERVMKMTVLHDLPESITGDYVPGKVTKKQKRLEERDAIDLILHSVPRRLRSHYKGIWEEYLFNKSDIARLVHAVDKLEMVLQAREYIREGHPGRTLAPFLNFPKGYLKEDRFEIISRILNT